MKQRSKVFKDTVAGAKNYIFLLLKIRFRSEKEVREKLHQKGFSEPTADEAVGYFKGIDLINDRHFARKWAAARLAKPWGVHRIRRELKEKGIAPGIIDQELKETTADYPEEDIVKNLARRRAQKCGGIAPEKIKQRVYGYLMRRGFNPAVVLKAIKDI